MKPAGTRSPDITSHRAPAVALFFLTLAVYLLTYVGTFKTNDERAMFSSADSFVKRIEFTSNQIFWDYTNVGMLTTAGEMVPNYEPAQSILAIPLYLWGRAFDAAVQGAMVFNLLVTSATASLIYLIVVALGYDRRTSTLSALIFALTTIAWPYSKTFFRDPLATFAYVLTFFALLRYRPPAARGALWPAVVGLGLGLAIATKQVSIVLLPSVLLLVVAYEWFLYLRLSVTRLPSSVLLLVVAYKRNRPGGWAPRLRALFAAAIPFLLIFLLTQLYYRYTLSGVELFARNVVEFTTNPQLSTSSLSRMGRAALGLTISPFRGIFWYAPVLLVGLVGTVPFLKRHRWEGLAFLGIIGATLLGYSRYNYWSAGAGGAGWGSRYMLTVVPFLVILAAPVWEWLVQQIRGKRPRTVLSRLLVVLLVTIILLSTVSQLIGVSINTTTYELRYILSQAEIYGGVGEAIDATYMMPRFSPLFGNLQLLLTGSEPLDVAWVQGRPQGEWALLPSGLLLSLGYLGVAVLAGWQLWRRPRSLRYVGPMMGAGTILILTFLLLIYRTGDSRLDPYDVDRFLTPLVDSLHEVPCSPPGEGIPQLCDGALIVPDPVLTDYLLARLDAPLPWYAIREEPAPEDTQLLDTLSTRYPRLYLLRDRSAQADEEQGRRAAEHYLATRAYKLGETQVEGWSRLIEFSAAGQVAELWDVGQSLGEMALVEAILRVQAAETIPPRAGPVERPPREPLDDGLVQLETGEVLQLGLEWQAAAEIGTNYTVFVQLLDEAGEVALQSDRWPGDGLFPTTGLAAGNTIQDNLALRIDLPPGSYRLIAGMYQAGTEGAPRLSGPEGDAILLAEVVVRE